MRGCAASISSMSSQVRRPLATPPAVVADADGLGEPTMRRVTREFNQSETTFLLPPTQPDALWRLRSFTPSGAEVFGAGHNPLGAWWLAEAGHLALKAPRTTFAKQLGDRVLPVEIMSTLGKLCAIGMVQASPSFGAVCTDLRALAAALRATESDILIDRLPAQVISTEASHLLVPARNRAAVDSARPDAEGLAALSANAGRTRVLSALPRVARSGGHRVRAILQPHGGHLGGSGNGKRGGTTRVSPCSVRHRR